MQHPPIAIRTVTTSRDLRRFIGVPWEVYNRTDHPQWVPPLRIQVRDLLSQKNPIWKRMDRELFFAERGGRAIGRIAAIENRAHNDYHNERVGFFGFFECRDDPEAAGALLAAARDWLRARGLEAMRGPVSPSTNHEVGLLVRGFRHHPLVLTPWNPPYYAKLIEGAGLRKLKDLLGYPILMHERFQLPPAYQEQAERARADIGLTFRNVDLKHFDEELETVWKVYHSAWEPNWGFVPMTKEEFLHLGKDLKPLLVPEFAFIAEVDGAPAGFTLILPDFNRILKEIPNGRLFPTGLLKLLRGKSRLRTGRLMAMGIVPRYRTRGIFSLFGHEIFRRAKDYGGIMGEASWILEDNERMTRPLRRLGLKAYRQWRIYEGSTV